MNRSTRTIVVVGIAVAAAAVASLGAYGAIKRMPVREVEVRSLYQVVATHDMTMGTMITKDAVKLVAWPASSPVEKGFTTIESVLNRGLIDSVVANEPLTESKLAPIEAGAGLPPSITEGMRAVSVKVNEVIGVAGFVVPGTRVDVMVTLRRDRGEGQHDPRGRERRAGAHGRHAVRPGEGARRPADSNLRRDLAGHRRRMPSGSASRRAKARSC